ncbi:IclR family transcriptional regulator [Cryptosporangium arvum]|uniref:Transcriptional regulator n=1 Tax=Cryptosporangium arvum DSM 44712 TaxID=927661 RepID=A0A011ACF1_9ACTN|nr:IclR family transcriptional regulator [Cryptosporangium arvum]EXG79711.1 transcriptional regulator [Cryptosporangium arvum DSM 44712]
MLEPVPEIAPVSPAPGDEELPRAERGTPAIQAVERAATILGAFSVGRPRLSLNELTARLGTSKATAHRYTKALRSVNLLRYDEREALYSLGPQVLTLSAAARAGLPIITIAGPYMEELVREAGETVVLSVWDGDTAVVVRVDDNTDRTVRISVRTGARLSMSRSAQGRVFCAFLDEDEVPGLGSLLRRNPDLRSELEAIRENGISVNTPADNGVRTIAAPVFQDATIVATMAIVGTTAAVADETGSPAAQSLLHISRSLTQELGASGPITRGF